MSATTVRARLAQEDGFTLIELLVVVVCLGFIMAGLTNVFVSGIQTQARLDGQINAQQSSRLALDSLEYQGRCASTASVGGSGSAVSFTLPSQCSNGTGTITWCVVSGVLESFQAASCSGTATIYARYLTSATPFSLNIVTGDRPQLIVQLVANQTGHAGDVSAVNDTITLRNAAVS